MTDQTKEKFEFSNFAASPICIDGITYFTAEAAYQAGKTVDPVWKQKLGATKNPVIAKRLGGRVPLKPNWNRLAEMEKVLRVKFAPGSEWAQRLIDTHDRQLIERNSWHDVYWGSCRCSRCDGKGENHLGLLLQKLRKELQTTDIT